MTKAIVIKTVGDPEIAGAIADAMSRRVIPLDREELDRVKAELARVKAEKREQEAVAGVRKNGDDQRWLAIQADLEAAYAVKRHGRVYEAVLGAWAMLWLSVLDWVRFFQAWNREG